jgi:TnpA family transposase
VAYGQLIKTRFILRYLQSQPLRQRIYAQLNKGEELHALRTWLWFGSEGIIYSYASNRKPKPKQPGA